MAIGGSLDCRPSMVRGRRMGWRAGVVLLMLAAGPAFGQPAAPPEVGSERRIFLPAPITWDTAMLSSRPTLRQTATDFASLTGGVRFGMAPSALNRLLETPTPGLSWRALSLANEFQDEVRVFSVPFEAAGSLRMGVTSCTGARSSLAFLFSPQGLFRLSYRLLSDNACPDTRPAARQILARYVPIDQDVARSVRYRAGRSDVVDVTDPASGVRIPVRWRPRAE